MPKAAAERTRKAALNRLVRGRRWAMVRRNSTVWRFFCRGYSGEEAPSTTISEAWISKGCLASGVSNRVPVTRRAAPTFWEAISLKFSIFPSSNTTCTPLKEVPSFRSIKPRALESRIDRAQPQTVTVFPA